MKSWWLIVLQTIFVGAFVTWFDFRLTCRFIDSADWLMMTDWFFLTHDGEVAKLKLMRKGDLYNMWGRLENTKTVSTIWTAVEPAKRVEHDDQADMLMMSVESSVQRDVWNYITYGNVHLKSRQYSCSSVRTEFEFICVKTLNHENMTSRYKSLTIQCKITLIYVD